MSKHHLHLSLLCVFVLLVLSMPDGMAFKTLRAQSALPNDLIFSTGQANAKGLPQSHNILARLNAQTGQVSSFYADPSAVFLKALSWSPDGKLLAFLRVQYDGRRYPAQLCLLNRSGALQGCFDDAPVGYFSVYHANGITWSPDGARLYFVSGGDKTRLLLEADVSTRKTLRNLYEYPLPDNQLDNPPVLVWTPDLGYLTIGAGDHTRVQQRLPVLLVDLKTKQTVDLAHIPGTEGASLFVVCPFFSPKGTYLTAYNFDVPETPIQPQFVILNKQGALVSTIKPAAPLNALPMGCPTWQADEKVFYFPLSQGTQQASTLHILKYALDSQQFTEAFSLGPLNNLAEATVASPMALSLDERFLVFDSPFAPDMNVGTQVTVISLGGMLRRYSTPFRFSSDALWSPHLGSDF